MIASNLCFVNHNLRTPLFNVVLVCYSVRTPGGKLVYQYLKKPGKIPRCGQCKDTLRGIQPARPMERSRMAKRLKTVRRAYGGVLCHKCVKERWVHSYLVLLFVFYYTFKLFVPCVLVKYCHVRWSSLFLKFRSIVLSLVQLTFYLWEAWTSLLLWCSIFFLNHLIFV